MGMSGGGTTKTKETATTKPNLPAAAQPAVTDYYNQVTNLGKQIGSDPSLFVTPANSTQTAAISAANNLGGWKSGLDSSTAMATKAANAKVGPAVTTNAEITQADPAAQATAASLFDVPFEQYQNPATEALVDTTLSSFDDNSDRVRAAQAAQAAKGGAFGGSRYGIAQAQTEADLARGRAGTEADLRSSAFDRATNLAAIDAANRQQTSLFNTGAINDNSMFNVGQTNQGSLFNAGQANDNSRFNADLARQRLADQISASQVISGNAATSASNARADAQAQLAAGNAQYEIDRANQLAPITSLAAYNGLIDPSLLAAVSGQTVNSSGTTKQSGGLLGQLIGAGAQLGGAAILASDRRVKRDIRQLGALPDGLGVYSFNYHWDEPGRASRVGVMADEVARLRPHALGPETNGIQTVNYGAL